jgi:hypothetical protein
LSIPRGGVRVRHDLNQHSIRIRKSQHLLVKSFPDLFQRNATIGKPLLPIFQRAVWNAEGGPRYFPGAGMSARGVWPGEKSEDGSGRAGIVAKVKMIGPGVVKIDRALDKAQA